MWVCIRPNNLMRAATTGFTKLFYSVRAGNVFQTTGERARSLRDGHSSFNLRRVQALRQGPHGEHEAGRLDFDPLHPQERSF